MTNPSAAQLPGVAAHRASAQRAEEALLVVASDPVVQAALDSALSGAPQARVTARSIAEAKLALESNPVAVVVSDQRSPDAAQLAALLVRHPHVQQVVVASEGMGPDGGVFRALPSSWDPESLGRAVGGALDQHRILRDNERLWQLTERQNTELRSLNRDLEERIRRRTGQLVRAKLEWEATFDAIVDPVAIIDSEFRVVRANVAFGRGNGVDVRSVPGQRCYSVLAGRDSPCVGCPLHAALAGHQPRSVDIAATGNRVLEVSAYPLEVSSKSDERPLDSDHGETVPLRAVCYYRDVTDARALSAELERTRRLASLGLFVGGVAHEINNPLGAILAFTQILLRSPDQDGEVKETLEEIQTSALRTKRIIGSLISFAQGSELRHAQVQLGDIVTEAVAAFRRDYGANPPIELTVPPVLPTIQGDATLLHQLFRNLLQNADHALDGKSGRIAVSVEAGPGGTVVVEVSDDGVGIPEGQLGRVFDPFFTTKLDGRGTGLGLSICHRIVEQHRGNIEVRSKVGVGTTFRVIFPERMRSGEETA